MAVPVLSTVAITGIQWKQATSWGSTITSTLAVTAKWVCWNTTGTPTIADPKTSNWTGTAAFTSTITPLLELTTYYVRAYATNSDWTWYGNELDFTTLTNPVLNDSRLWYQKPTRILEKPKLLDSWIWYRMQTPLPEKPKLLDSWIWFGRPTFMINVFPALKDAWIGFDRPVYSPPPFTPSNPVFMFAWF